MEQDLIAAIDRFVAKLDSLIDLMAKNERDRELSPHWRHNDGSMVTRAEYEATFSDRGPFEGPAK